MAKIKKFKTILFIRKNRISFDIMILNLEIV